MTVQLTTRRILSIDAFRGITILVMIFVNELSGVSGIPAWMKHMPAEADAMTFVDMVFPAFLFIVGMSIPFALNSRLAKGDSILKVQAHILIRTLGLLVLGVFMVNADNGNNSAMPLSIYLWSLLFYAAVIMIWNFYGTSQKLLAVVLRVAGISMLVILAVLYRGGESGMAYMSPQWWGILGLIGWAYAISCIIYQLVSGNIYALLISLVLCLLYYIIGRSSWIDTSATLQYLFSSGHVITSAIVLCGVVLTLLFFNESVSKTITRRFIESLAFTAALFLIGYMLRPYYQISKIHGTPTWAFYSAAWCCLIFSLLYWLVDIKKYDAWTSFFKPAAANPLLTYIIPFIIYALIKYFDLSLPGVFYDGLGGILWSATYAILVMALVMGLNRLHIKLQL